MTSEQQKLIEEIERDVDDVSHATLHGALPLKTSMKFVEYNITLIALCRELDADATFCKNLVETNHFKKLLHKERGAVDKVVNELRARITELEEQVARWKSMDVYTQEELDAVMAAHNEHCDERVSELQGEVERLRGLVGNMEFKQGDDAW